MTLREQLVTIADAYGALRKIGRQRVSTLVLNRGATLDALAEGRVDVNTGTFEKAMRWFADNWPDDADWPENIDRPRTEAAR